MIPQRVLRFYALFFLFAAVIGLLHAFLSFSFSYTSPLTGYAILSESSAPMLGLFSVVLVIIALIFLKFATRRFMPRVVARRIVLEDLYA
ncbi:MAG: hypothetical protein AABX53_02400 [Nanoarchaeota archaeon]